MSARVGQSSYAHSNSKIAGSRRPRLRYAFPSSTCNSGSSGSRCKQRSAAAAIASQSFRRLARARSARFPALRSRTIVRQIRLSVQRLRTAFEPARAACGRGADRDAAGQRSSELRLHTEIRSRRAHARAPYQFVCGVPNRPRWPRAAGRRKPNQASAMRARGVARRPRRVQLQALPQTGQRFSSPSGVREDGCIAGLNRERTCVAAVALGATRKVILNRPLSPYTPGVLIISLITRAGRPSVRVLARPLCWKTSFS